ncbi:MAG: CU044_5270 family protein [Kutzneria sp.]|nr:CU044_5270 family protein [Kutzneria sp.]MBV9847799.1 CU044_5270 family protein [Kutzneria sp.]
MREMWTEDKLDEALTTLHSDVETDEQALARARAQLMVAANAEPERELEVIGHTATSRGKRWWLASAAAVATVVAGALVSQTIQFGDTPAMASAQAAELLNRAASQPINATDPPVGPNQYRYIGEHAWWVTDAVVTQGKRFSYLGENVQETWEPAAWGQEWLQRRTVTGERKWITGTEDEARKAGILGDSGPSTEEFRAPCGDFFASDNQPVRRPCDHQVDGWQHPTPEWLATLPRDPKQLYDRLREDAPRNGRGNAEVLVYAADALRTGLLPADVRSALYRALTYLPGLEITEQPANLDGHKGTAFGIKDTADERQDVIIDPVNGQFIGEREVSGNGTVLSSTSVATAVVGKMGEEPAS